MLKLSCLALAVIAFAPRAFADPPGETQPVHADRRHAVLMSAGGTALSLALIGTGLALDAHDNGASYGPTVNMIANGAVTAGLVGLLVLPSLGHHERPTRGLIVRSVGLGVVVAGGLLFVGDNLGWCTADGGPCPPTNYRGAEVMGVGAATMVVGAIWDIATAGRMPGSFQVVPTAMRDARNQTAGGIGLVRAF